MDCWVRMGGSKVEWTDVALLREYVWSVVYSMISVWRRCERDIFLLLLANMMFLASYSAFVWENLTVLKEYDNVSSSELSYFIIGDVASFGRADSR